MTAREALAAVATLLEDYALPEHGLNCRTDSHYRFRWPNASCDCFLGQLRAVLADHDKDLANDKTHSRDEADGMCPNCLTPWKCNGPHEDDRA